MKQPFPISGTFIDDITYDIPSSNWSLSQWNDELDYMQGVGIDTLIFIRGGFEGRTLFPSKNFVCWKKYDFADFIFKQATQRNMKVFMGLYISNLTWNDGDVQEELRQNKIFTAEVVEKYGHYPSFVGWYIPHEASHNVFNVGKVITELAKLCKEITPDKQTLVSPFFRSKITSDKPFSPQRFYQEWKILYDSFGKYVDICAFQDGTAPLNQFDEYLSVAKRLCDEHDMRLWTNVEGFERDPRYEYYPIPFELLQTKLEMSQKYVEKSIMFEFSHFLSPQSIYPSAKNLYNLYVDYYGKNKR